MRVEGAPPVEAVQLPDAEADAKRRSEEDQQGGENPRTAEHVF